MKIDLTRWSNPALIRTALDDNVVISAARAAGGEGARGARPPRFVVGELVQIETIVRGLEAFPAGPCDIEALTGLEATVEGAMPVAGAWVIAVSVADRLVLGFPEDALRSTGMVLVDSDRVPRERVPDLAWRDDI